MAKVDGILVCRLCTKNREEFGRTGAKTTLAKVDGKLVCRTCKSKHEEIGRTEAKTTARRLIGVVLPSSVTRRMRPAQQHR